MAWSSASRCCGGRSRHRTVDLGSNRPSDHPHSARAIRSGQWGWRARSCETVPLEHGEGNAAAAFARRRTEHSPRPFEVARHPAGHILVERNFSNLRLGLGLRWSRRWRRRLWRHPSSAECGKNSLAANSGRVLVQWIPIGALRPHFQRAPNPSTGIRDRSGYASCRVVALKSHFAFITL